MDGFEEEDSITAWRCSEALSMNSIATHKMCMNRSVSVSSRIRSRFSRASKAFVAAMFTTSISAP